MLALWLSLLLIPAHAARNASHARAVAQILRSAPPLTPELAPAAKDIMRAVTSDAEFAKLSAQLPADARAPLADARDSLRERPGAAAELSQILEKAGDSAVPGEALYRLVFDNGRTDAVSEEAVRGVESAFKPLPPAGAREPGERKEPPVPFYRSPGGQFLSWMAAAAAYGVGVWSQLGQTAAVEYLTTYVLELALSIDNMLVISTVIHALPLAVREKALRWGLWGTVLARLVMVYAGASIVSQYTSAFYFFGALLLVIALKMIRHDWDLMKVAARPFARAARSIKPAERLPWLTKPIVWGTLAVIGYGVVFALDSVPVGLAITTSLPILFAANLFSVMGLGPLYKLLDWLEKKFGYLEKGVGVALVFVALKMILEPMGVLHVSAVTSLIVTFGIMGAAIVLSLLYPPQR